MADWFAKLSQLELADGFQMNVEVVSDIVQADTLLIHGNLASNNWWRPAIAAWDMKRTRDCHGKLICAEWRGCGKNRGPASDDEIHPAALAQDYIQVVERNGGSPVNIIGHSYGGLIALHAMRARPELFNRAVLLDPVSANGIAVSPEKLRAFSEMCHDRQLCKTILHATIHGNDAGSAFFDSLVTDAFKATPNVWRGVLAAIGTADFLEDLPKIHQPVLVLHGEYDTILPMSESSLIAEKLPAGEFRVLPNQGHSMNVENPYRFVQIVDEFLFSRDLAYMKGTA